MRRWRFIALGVMPGMAVLVLAACGGSSGGFAGAGEFPLSQMPAESAAGNAGQAREVALDDALAEVAAYRPPSHGDRKLNARLTDELQQVLIDLYGDDPDARTRRLVSALSPEERNCAWAVQCASNPAGDTTLYFRGRHFGDYNMDGLVSVSDITPLGFNFGANVSFDADGLPSPAGDNEWAAVTDGNEDGQVGVADITPIGQNWNSRHLGYRIYLGRSNDGVNFTWDTDYLPNLVEAGQPVSLDYADSREAGEVQLYSYKFTRPSLAAGEMLYARIVPFDGTSEGLASEIAVNDGPHAPFKCEVCHVMTDLAFRQPEGSCHNCHAAPPEDSAQAWTDAPGLHASCMSCHAAHGFSIDPPESACGACHSSIAADVGAAGMPQCLGCHQTPHLPNTAPGPTECRGCHTEPPDVAGGDWDSAPGQHANCTQCHTRHVFAVAAPNSVCETCHSDKYDGSHGGGSTECLTCHQSPHLPEVDVGELDCQDCHPAPPENLNASWLDAPGDHAQCELCHVGEHGSKPDPPESVCADCHSELISAGHAGGDPLCLGCHLHPHLPETEIVSQDCLECHPTPPENPEASWDDAPGLHDQCDQCHDTAQHGDKPVPPESVCGDCHSELIDGGHAAGEPACLDCHSYPHLPDFSTMNTDEQCQICHTDYTNPGAHDQGCFICHTEGEHPPGGGWDTCIDCHEF